MIDFVGTPILENRIMGRHGNHAFSHSKNKCFRTIFSHIGGSNEQYGTHEKLS